MLILYKLKYNIIENPLQKCSQLGYADKLVGQNITTYCLGKNNWIFPCHFSFRSLAFKL